MAHTKNLCECGAAKDSRAERCKTCSNHQLLARRWSQPRPPRCQRSRPMDVCECGQTKQTRSKRCRSCSSRLGQARGLLTRCQPHDLALIDVPRAAEQALHLPSFITGLWDGEGCFVSSYHTKATGQVVVNLSVTLLMRADDLALVQQVANYFGVGTVRTVTNRGTAARPNDKPVVIWSCSHARKLVAHVLPHFDRYPPRGKKRREYELWREAVCRVAAWRPGTTKSETTLNAVIDLIHHIRTVRQYPTHLAHDQ